MQKLHRRFVKFFSLFLFFFNLGFHKSLKIRAQYNGKTQLVIPVFMDEEVTSWVQRLRPLETQEVDMRALNLHNPMYKKLKMKVDKLERELEAKMDQNSLTVSKVSLFKS